MTFLLVLRILGKSNMEVKWTNVLFSKKKKNGSGLKFMIQKLDEFMS